MYGLPIEQRHKRRDYLLLSLDTDFAYLQIEVAKKVV